MHMANQSKCTYCSPSCSLERTREVCPLWGWKEAAGSLNHCLLHEPQLWEVLRTTLGCTPLLSVSSRSLGMGTLWLSFFTRSSVNTKKSGIASTWENDCVYVGLWWCFSSWKNRRGWKARWRRWDRQILHICLWCTELTEKVQFSRRNIQ